MTGKRRTKPASPISQDMVADMCHAIYLRHLGPYDAKHMVEKDEQKFPGCGDSKLRTRALGYQGTVRSVLEELHARGLLIMSGALSSDIPELPGDDPVDSDDIPEVEE